MNIDIKETNALKMLRQRNAMGLFSVVIAISNLILCTTLFFQSEKTIVLPPELKHGIWFKGSSVSREYLEEMTIFFAHLLLDKNDQNSRFNHTALLKYVHPKSHSSVMNKLLADEVRYKKEGLSTNFFPNNIEVNVATKTTVLSGDLVTRVGNRQITKTKKKFLVIFDNQHSRWWLKEFVIEEQKNG